MFNDMGKKKVIGVEIIGDLKKCNRRVLYSQTVSELKNKISELVKKYELTELGSYYHKFKGGGITGVIALAESHIAFHTWVEEEYTSLNIFVCNYRRDNTKAAKRLFSELSDLFCPSVIDKQEIVRSRF